MKIEIRPGRPRIGIAHTEQAIVVFKPGLIEGFFKSEERRIAVHKWGMGWYWEDSNKPCPAQVEIKLNREALNVH